LWLTAKRGWRSPRLGCVASAWTETADGGAIALPVLDIARAQGLAFVPAARLDAPVGPIGPLEESALELMRLAQVLPAAIVARNDGAKPIFPNLLGVARDDVQSFSITRLAALRIVSRARVPLEGALECEFVVFRGGEGLRDQVAIVIGSPDFSAP
jgi:GTP cyclohydrolase II